MTIKFGNFVNLLSEISLSFGRLLVSAKRLVHWGAHETQERKISPKSKFLGRISRGHPGVIRADIPAQNFGEGAQNLEK